MKLVKIVIITLLFSVFVMAQSHSTETEVDGKSGATNKTEDVDAVSSASQVEMKKEFKRVAILWTTDNKEVFTKVVFPYVFNSKKMKWWNEVTLIVWGPSSKLLAEDNELHENIKKLEEAGVILTACKWCSDQYKVSEVLAGLNIDVKYMGKPLTEFLQTDVKVITF